MQVVLEAGAESLDPLLVATKSLLAGADYRLEILQTTARKELDYVGYDGELSAIGALLRGGSISSARFIPHLSSISWLMLFCPMFDEEGVPWWSMVVEYRTSLYDEALDKLRSIPGLTFVSVSVEESLEFSHKILNPHTFPWTHWRLIRAAVRNDDGTWVEHSGPSDAE